MSRLLSRRRLQGRNRLAVYLTPGRNVGKLELGASGVEVGLPLDDEGGPVNPGVLFRVGSQDTEKR